MTRNEAVSRLGSITSSGTDSNRSSVTIKPTPAAGHRRAAAPMRLKTDDNGNLVRSSKDDNQVSPTSTTAGGARFTLSPGSATSNSSSYHRDHRLMSDFSNYRRDLAVLETSGGRPIPQIQHNPPTAVSISQVAPWMTSSNGGSSTPSSGHLGGGGSGGGAGGSLAYYNDSTDNLSLGSQLSPGFRSGGHGRSVQTPNSNNDSPDIAYFGDERRPSLASVTTASSQGSRSSTNRGGLRKLQGFFGEEFPGRDGAIDTPTHGHQGQLPPVPGKEHRSHSYSNHHRPHRERNFSNATDHGRESSPSGSRPRTPLPSSDVVPFLYQEVDDIAKYGEAPVRDMITGPDRDRYVSDNPPQVPPKTSSSARSGHSIVHLSGHHHRHNKSNEDSRSIRPSISREDSGAMAATFKERSTFAGSRSRAQSPTPSAYHSGSQTFPTLKSSAGDLGGPTSPTHHGRRGILSRFKRHKDKDEGASGSLRNMPGSKASLALSRPPTLGKDDTAPQIPPWMGMPVPDPMESYSTRHGYQKQGATFNKNLFGKKSRSHRVHDGDDENIGPTDRHGLHVFHLDTNLSDMEGIVTKFPDKNIDTSLFSVSNDHDGDLKQPDFPSRIGGSWNAPDSWAVRRTTEDNIGAHLPELDENGMPHRVEERSTPYGIRVFRSDGTFATLQMPVNSTVSEVITQLLRKSLVNQSIETYHILLKKHNIVRVLSPFERPIVIQKRLLQEVGYEEADRIEEIGREDNSYLCRFLFLSEKDATFHSFTDHSGLTKLQKVNHVDLSGRNLLTIPISLYSKAGDIMALNLSRNLSLDLPRDFIQLCQNLRDIKFNNNEARKLPPSLSRANKLTYLDVSNNRLDSLDQAELGGLTGLIKLDLSNNRLKHLPPYFGAFRALRTLNISSNFLDTFPVFLCDLACLVDIDASFNAIGSLPDEIGNLKNLEKLVITNNRLAGLLPGTFNQLHSLRELDIKYNAITGIDVIAELPKLEILSADHNHISHFGGGFETIRRLKLNANPITRFEIKTMTPTLKDLNLSNAQLASIDESFNNMPNLERLVLDRNYFVSLPNQLGNLRRLETFSIANNVIAELPPEIGCLTELRVLDVRGNNIRKLPMEIWYANKLETLNASSNVLENFPKPSSRAPVPPSDSWNGSPSAKGSIASGATQSQGTDEASADGSRRPSQASSTLLSVGPSPVPGGADRKSSVVSVYGKGGRKTSVVSRTTSATSSAATPVSNTRKDSGLAARVTNTFAGSLRNLYLADNQLDDDVFDQIILLNELRVINLSYNVLTDMPQRSIKSWPQLVELYLSGNELTSLPADDLEEYSLLQVLHINGNKFQNLPADISRAKKLAVFDCGSNQLKYNIANVPYDWNWNLNPALRYLNLSGNKRLEIKESHQGSAARDRERYADFSRLQNLRILGLMDVTLTVNSIPDQNEDRRVRTTGSIAGFLPYGMADTMGKNEHLSTIDLLVPRFNSNDGETLLGLFDGINTLSGGSKIAKYLQENFGQVFAQELKALKNRKDDTPADALRRTFLSLNKDLATMAFSQTEDRPIMTTPRGGGSSPLVLTKEDLNSGGIATVAYLQNQDLYVANVGDTQAVLIGTDGSHRFLTRKHDPAEPSERQRIRDAGGWVSRNGKLNDFLDVSRAFGIIDLMPVVMASPHITKHTITEQDEMVVIATRELWEWVAPGLVVDIARSERGDLMRAAQKLRDLAMSYGAKDKIMVMAISVADLKRRVERSRMHRGQSMSLYPSGLPDEAALLPTRRGRKKMDVLDSTLQRLEAEVAPPTGWVAIVFTDIKNSTNLWETYPSAMRSAIKLHNEVMRRQLRRIGGYEVKTEGDAFMVSFPTATSSLLWAFSVQAQLLDVAWPPEMLNSVSCQEIRDKDDNVIFKGLSVRMGIHWGFPVSETDPVTRRMDYYGPMVNKASRISAVADGGQITVSADFIQEIQRCLMTYQDEDRANSIASGGPGGPDDAAGQSLLDDDQMAAAIRKELRMLSSIGFEVKDLGEIKLKGLENPELVYSLYPHSLVGRVEYHLAHHARVNNAEAPAAVAAAAAAASAAAEGKPATLIPGSMLSFDPEVVWAIWKVSLRLEMLCSSLEEVSGRGLQPPETELLDRMKQRGGEVTERFIMNFLEHQISRIETCVTTLAIRHMMIGGGTIMQLNDLRAPMSTVISSLADQLSELQRYRAMYGPLPPVSRPVPARGRTHSHSRHTNRHTIIHEVDEDEPEEEITVEEVDDDDAGSDTEHE